MRLLTIIKAFAFFGAALLLTDVARSQTTTYLDESFDNSTFPPTGWSNVMQVRSSSDGTTDWLWSRVTSGSSPSCSPYSGSAMAKFTSYSAHSPTSVRLTSKSVDLTETATNTLSFYMYRDAGYSSSADKIDVYVDDDTTIVNGARLLGTVNRSTSLSPTVSSNGWYQYTYAIPDSFLIANAYIHFKATSAYGNNMYIDAVSLTGKDPIIPDASISGITFPTAPYTEGTYPISATLKNSGTKGTVKKATIRWSVNGIEQAPVQWSGKLSVNQTVDISLGNYTFAFGQNGPWDPFSFNVRVTDVNGAANDIDPSNDSKTSTTSPTMDDGGLTAISQPSGKFGAGTHGVYVSLKNYSRKPLTSAKIGWSIDGVEQTPRNWAGSLAQNNTTEVLLGNFDFQFSKPIKSNEFKTWLIEANGKPDYWTSNNAAPDRLIAPALVPGVYTVGTPTSHFTKLSDMAKYLSVIGIVGAGDVTINIEPGVYNERVKIENTDPANNIILRSSTGAANDVVWQATTTMSEPYTVLLNNVNNINISNITFRFVEPTGYSAFIIAGSGVNGFTLNKNIFNGTAGSTQQFAMVSLTNSSSADIRGNQFMNGANQLSFSNATDGRPVSMVVKDNLFKDFTRQAVTLEANTSTSTDNVEIAKNTVMNNKLNKARTAFEVRGHSAKITYNTLENLAATPAPGDVNAGIKVMAGDAGKTEINNNEINNVENVNGIYVTGPSADIRKNKILVSSSVDGVGAAGIFFAGGDIRAAYNEIVVNAAAASNGMNGIQLAAATGYVANNAVVGNNINGAVNYGVNGVNYIYNTFNVRGDATTALHIFGGSAYVARNIFVNRGPGSAFEYAAPATVAGVQNNFYSAGAGTPNDITKWNTLTGDQTSISIKPTFNEDAGTKLGRYVSEMVFNTPLNLPSDVDADLQKYDFSGNERNGFWYAGSNGMNLSIAIIEQPKELIECEGSKNLSMKVVAQVTGGAETYFQWYKDGQPIPGETKSVFRIPALTKELTGVYKCHVYGPANVAAGLDTKDLVVYTLGATSIVSQDTAVTVGAGEKATLHVEAHIKGITAPFFQQKYQWYRRLAGAPDEKLTDGDKFSGANTPDLVIKNVQAADYFDGSLGYVLEVEGQCGKVFSKAINLLPKSGVQFATYNQNVDRCSGEEPINWDVSFQYFGKFDKIIVEHITSDVNSKYYGHKETIDFSTSQPRTYTWSYTTDGAMTSANNQTQKTRVTMLPGGQVWETPEVTWTFHDAPKITTQPQATTVEEEKELALAVETTSDSPVVYQWMRDGAKIEGATAKTYYVASATAADAGVYSVVLTNDCGATISDAATVTVTPKGIKTAHESEASLGIVSISPNPATETIEIGFSSEKSGSARFTILELSGREATSFTAEAAPEARTIRRDVSSLGSGSYFLVMEIGGKRFVERFVVVK